MKVASPPSTLFICGHTFGFALIFTDWSIVLALFSSAFSYWVFFLKTILWPSEFLFCYVCVLNFMPLSITACRSFHFLIQFSKVFQDIKDLHIAYFKLVFYKLCAFLVLILVILSSFLMFWYHYLLSGLLFCFSSFFFILPATLMQFSFFPRLPLKIFYTLKDLNLVCPCVKGK